MSSAVGATNGHAARMRYSRFKQRMDGNARVRRVSQKNTRTSKQYTQARAVMVKSEKVNQEVVVKPQEKVMVFYPDSSGSLVPPMQSTNLPIYMNGQEYGFPDSYHGAQCHYRTLWMPA